MSNEAIRNRRLTVLKAEVAFDFEGLLPALDGGIHVLLVNADEHELVPSLDPDALRRIGGMVALCNEYGVTVIFAKPSRVYETSCDASAKP